MTPDPTAALVARLTLAGFDPRPTGPDSWESRCPGHNGSRRNLSVRRGDDGRALIHCHHADEAGGCDHRAILAALGMAEADLFPPVDSAPPGARPGGFPQKQAKNREANRQPGSATQRPRAHPTPETAIAGTVRKLGDPTASWPYHAADGSEAMRVYRFDPPGGPKEYRPVHPTPEGWVMGDPPGALPIYGLPELAGASRVYFFEGEKCCDLARDILGVVATTTAHGAKSPHKSDLSPLAGMEVVICPDADAAGDAYAAALVGLLAELSPRPRVKIVRLADLWRTRSPIPEGGDIEQWNQDGVSEEWDGDQCRAELDRVTDLTPKEGLDISPPAEPAGDDTPVPVPSWPDPPEAAAFAGLAGEFVRIIEPHTEADPAAILVQLLIGFGNLIGRNPYFAVEADRHHCNEFAALVGDTAKGRKGTSWGYARGILGEIDPGWAAERLMSGLSTGEGLIFAVRDAVTRREPIKEGKRIIGFQDVEVDPGESDKRILCVESELGGTLRIATRDGNSLSALVRQSWDTGDLRTMTRNNPLRATGAHVSIIGHVTRDELLKLLSRIDAANGFANRFLWIAVRRSKALPFGGSFSTSNCAGLATQLRDAADFGRAAGRIGRDASADTLWADAYGRLSAGRPGLLGAVTSRAEPHAMRLAMLYALLDRSLVIRADHLRSALALWDYAERSAAFIFGDSLGDPDADRLLEALRSAPDGLTRNEIREQVFQRNKPSEIIARLLARLSAAGLAHSRMEETGGRKAERWFAGNAPTRLTR